MTKTRQRKRYFGMTILQSAILGCLAFVACGTIAGGIFFVSEASMGGGGSSIFPSPVLSSTPEPTFTPFLTETPTLSPTATLIQYEDLIPSGWNQYTTSSIEIWVPPDFETVDIEQERQDRIKLYRKVGLDDLADKLENDPPSYVLWFVHPDPDAVLIAANIAIESKLMTAESLDAFIDQEYADEDPRAVVVGRQEFQVGNYGARRLIEEVNLGSNVGGVAHYVIFDGVNVWIISCTSHFNEFYTWLLEFDKVARTFRLINQ